MLKKYKSEAVITDDKGRPVREGDELLITFSDGTTQVGVMTAPFCLDDLIYYINLPLETEACEVVSVIYYSCCIKLEQKFTKLLQYLGLQEDEDGNITTL